MIPQSFLDELLARVDIVSVIDRLVPLKKGGANYMACCPFHGEKTPSFTVTPAKQFYHCFGCGEHGNAISFLMAYQGLSFVDAVQRLASDCGLTVPEDHAALETREQVSPLIEAMQAADKYYRRSLRSSPAVAYLKGRGLTGEIAARFGLGYAPSGWQNLEAVFANYTNQEELARAGLVIDNDKGRRYDRFRDRVMFPIQNAKGQTIAFGGRVLGNGEPKYLNSPETPLFSKGRELYGLNLARDAIRKADYVLVVEGYMDVVALAQYGIANAVATLGTATTPDHLSRLFRQTGRVLFCFDGDRAGRQAAWRALNQALPTLTDAVQLDFVFLPEGEDPDSLVRKLGQEGFEAYLRKEVQALSEYLFAHLAREHDLQTVEGRAHFYHAAKPLLSEVREAPTMRDGLWQRLKELTRSVAVAKPIRVRSVSVARLAPLASGERLLGMLYQYPELWVAVPNEVRQALLHVIPDFARAALMGDVTTASLHNVAETQVADLQAWAQRLEKEWEGDDKLSTLLSLAESIMEREAHQVRRTRLAQLEKRGLAALSAVEKDEYRRLIEAQGGTLASVIKSE